MDYHIKARKEYSRGYRFLCRGKMGPLALRSNVEVTAGITAPLVFEAPSSVIAEEMALAMMRRNGLRNYVVRADPVKATS